MSTGQLLFADVIPGPGIQSGRGASAVSQSGSAYTAAFATSNVSRCSYTASAKGGALTSGQLGVESDPSSASAVIVTAPSGFACGFDLQLVC